MATFYAAGKNPQYNLGLGDAATHYTFAAEAAAWVKIESCTQEYGSEAFSIGLKSNGTLWGVGLSVSNSMGLPDGSYTTWTQIGTDANWADFSVGNFHIAAIKTNGTLWSAGWNLYGECGQGHTSNVATLTQVGSGTTWRSVQASRYFTLAIKTDGTLWGCGYNFNGELGSNLRSFMTTMTQEATASTLWASVSSTGGKHAIALRTDGTLWAWGESSDTQTGQGTTTDLFTPTQIGSATDWAVAKAGTYTSAAIKTDGTLWAWGRGQLYGLGTGDTTNRTTPYQVGTDTDWADVELGTLSMLALKTSGVIKVAGYNQQGQLGTGNTTTVTTLTTVSLAYNVASISMRWSAAFIAEAISLTEINCIAAAASPLLTGDPIAMLLQPSLASAPHLYRLTAFISGGDDGLADYPIPLTSFGMSKRSGAESYYSTSSQYSDDLLAALMARPNGRVFIQRDGMYWESFNIGHPVRYDFGPNNASISLSGSRQQTALTSATLTITPDMVASESISSDGQLTLNMVPGFVDPRPTDVIVWDGGSFTVTLKKVQAGASAQSLTISATPL